VALPFKDQISADVVRKELKDLSLKVHTTIQPVFVNRKVEQEPSIVNQQSVFNVTCDAGYVGYTRGHLHNHAKDINNNPPPLPNTMRTCTEKCLRAC